MNTIYSVFWEISPLKCRGNSAAIALRLDVISAGPALRPVIIDLALEAVVEPSSS